MKTRDLRKGDDRNDDRKQVHQDLSQLKLQAIGLVS